MANNTKLPKILNANIENFGKILVIKGYISYV